MAAPPKPPVIDAIEFARKSLAIHDTIALSHFSRLSDALASTDGALDYDLRGYVSADKRPRLRLQISGVVQLTCQRCLDPLEFAIATDIDYILVADEGMIPSEDEESDMDDYLVADSQTLVIGLLEDELLLALPFAPKHQECAGMADLKMESEKLSPFAVLKGLKTPKRD